MSKSKKVVIIGDSAFAEIAYEYFTHDSPYEVVGFSVEKAYLKKDKLFDLPVVPYEEITQHFAADSVEFYAALVYKQMNRLRTRFYEDLKMKGYRPASYVSSRAFVWPNVKLGEHIFIFEDNTVQPFVTIGNNVVLWSGNHVGHHSTVEENCFISSHVVISGFCIIGKNSFAGVNATLANNVKVGADNWIGLGAVITKDTKPNQLFKGIAAEVAKISSLDYFKVAQPSL